MKTKTGIAKVLLMLTFVALFGFCRVSMVRASAEQYVTVKSEKEVYQKASKTLKNVSYDTIFVCPEIYHKYQFTWCELYERIEERDRSIKTDKLYELERARVWAEEFRNYHHYDENGMDDFMEYYSQDVEYSANKFGEQMAGSIMHDLIYLEDTQE